MITNIYNTNNTSHYTSWLNEYEFETALFIAETYVYSMRDDLSALEANLHNNKVIFKMLHKLIGGLSMIGCTHLLARVKKSAAARQG